MMFDLFLGLAVIVCAMGWATQLGFTAYWRDRCSDLEASIRQPRHKTACSEPPPLKPAPWPETEPVQFVPGETVPSTVHDLRRVTLLPKDWPVPPAFAPKNLQATCR